jgi:enoyl-CoA hydratase
MTADSGMNPVVHYRVERAIATITLDSPANRNAFSAQLVAELSAQLDAGIADAAVRAIVLTHTGSTFCSGNDLREASAEGGPERSTARLLALLHQVVTASKPVIARVDGHARAGGIGLLGACDIALASAAASFAFTEVRLGLTPAIITLTTQTRMTERAAARYFLTGERFDAQVAERIGLITEFASDLDASLNALLDALRACSAQGLAYTKPLTTARMLDGWDELGPQLQALSARLFDSDEAREGLQAFLSRRPPAWAIE